MPSGVTSLALASSNSLREGLMAGIWDSLPKIEPLWNLMQTQWQTVKRDSIGRNWQVEVSFDDSIPTNYRWVNMGAEALASSSVNFQHSNVPGDPTNYPPRDEQALPATFRKIITLKKLLFSVSIPVDWFQSDMLPASLGPEVKRLIDRYKRGLALAEIQPFFSLDTRSSSSNPWPYASAQIGATITATNEGLSVTTDRVIVVPRGGSVNQFQNGQNFDIYDRDGLTRKNNVAIRVDRVRYLPNATNDTLGYGCISLRTVDGSAFPSISAGATGDILVPRNSVAVGPSGPGQWLVTNGTVFGINVSEFAHMQSVVADAGGVAFNASLGNRVMNRASEAFGQDNMPDVCLTRGGVTNAMIEAFPGVGSLEVKHDASEVLVPMMGYDISKKDFRVYTFNGQLFAWRSTNLMPSLTDFTNASSAGGILWSIKTRDQNITRWVPPAPGGATHVSDFGSEVYFPFKGGPYGVFLPEPATNGYSRWYIAHGERDVEICPKVFWGVNITGLRESN